MRVPFEPLTVSLPPTPLSNSATRDDLDAHVGAENPTSDAIDPATRNFPAGTSSDAVDDEEDLDIHAL